MERVETKCEWLCDAGYIESSDGSVTCKKVNDKPIWQPAAKCDPQPCGTGSDPLIAVESDQCVAYVTNYDTKRKLPIWSVALYDRKNRINVVPRKDSFAMHPCPKLKGDQYLSRQYTGSTYDRGHLSASAGHRYSLKATKSSNLMINVAPQVPWINSDPWMEIEKHLLCHNEKNTFASLVAAGICASSLGKTSTGIDIPACFWKMICYIRNGGVNVVGFISENQKGLDTSPGKNETIFKIFTPVSQATILARAGLTSSPFSPSSFANAVKGLSDKKQHRSTYLSFSLVRTSSSWIAVILVPDNHDIESNRSRCVV